MSKLYELNSFNKIHCFDPGGTTGYALISIDRARTRVLIDKVAEFQTWDQVENIISNIDTEKEIVLYESFKLWTMAANLIPVEVIGVIRFNCCKYNVIHFSQEPSNQGKQRFNKAGGKNTDTRPIVNRWYPHLEKFNSHHSSALRHGIYFCVTKVFHNKLPEIKYNYSDLMHGMNSF